MTVTLDSLTQLDARTVRAQWSSDLGGTPTFYVYVNGALERTTEQGSGLFHVEPGTNLHIEVLDDEDDIAIAVPDGRFLIGWPSGTSIDYYIIEEYVAAAWTERSRVIDDGRTWFFTWLSRFLEDETTHQFRVTAVDTDGNSSSTASVSALMVRHPDAPDVSYAYSSGTAKVTIAAA